MSNEIAVRIVGQDRATEVIDRVNARLGAIQQRVRAAAAPAERVGASLRRLSDTTGLTRSAQAAAELGRQGAAAAERIGRINPALAGLTGAASIAGVAALVDRWAGFGTQLGRNSDRIGIAARDLHGLQGAARLAGSSAEGLAGGLQTLGDNLVHAAAGRSPQTVMMMQTLGLAFRGANGEARRVQDVLPEVADRIAALKDPTHQAMVATALFGGAAEDLLPFLRRGSAGIREYTERAARLGLVNEQGVEAARRLRQGQTELTMAAEGLSYKIAQRLEPSLGPLLARMTEWIAKNGDLTATRVDEFIHSVGTNAERLGRILGPVGGSLDAAVTHTVGWDNAVQALAATIFLRALPGGRALTNTLAKLVAIRVPGWMIGLLGAGGAGALGAGLAGGAWGGTQNYRHGLEAERSGNYTINPETGQAVPGPGGSAGRALGVPEGGGSVGRFLGWLFGGGVAMAPRSGETQFRPTPQGFVAGSARRDAQDLEGRNARAREIPQDKAALARESYDFWIGKSFTPAGAAGMVAQEQQESGFDWSRRGDGGLAGGSFQHHKDRRDAILRATGIDVWDSNTTHRQQLEAAHAEMERGLDRRSGRAYAAIKGAASGYEAARLGVTEFERPKDTDKEIAQRGADAEAILRRYGTSPQQAPAAGASPARLARTDTSAPGGPQSALAARAPAMAAPSAPAMTVPASPAATAANGRVQIDVVHENVPPTVRTNLRSAGEGLSTNLRVEHAMPGFIAP